MSSALTPGLGSQLVRSVLLGACLFACGGCLPSHGGPAGAIESPAFDFPPTQLARDVKEIVKSPPISLPVEDEQAGAIVTGWKPFQGDLHIVRYWYERTRFHIAIMPDFNDPLRRSHIRVTDETEQRAEESGPNQKANQWTPAPDIHRPERSNALLQQIETQLATYHRPSPTH
jgi:hypothetical protein